MAYKSSTSHTSVGSGCSGATAERGKARGPLGSQDPHQPAFTSQTTCGLPLLTMKAVRSAATAAAARPSAARQVQPSGAPSSHQKWFTTQRRGRQLRCSAAPAGGPPPGAGGGAGRDYQIALITGGNTGDSALLLQVLDFNREQNSCRVRTEQSQLSHP